MLKKEKKFIYQESGEGDPVIILHGLMGAMSNFEGMYNFLSENGFKVYLPELPLFDFNILQTNVTYLKKYLIKFVEHLGLNKFHLIGNSLGGHIALLYVNENQEKVKSLSLLGSSGLYENAFGSSFPKRGDRDYMRNKVEDVFYNKEVITESLLDDIMITFQDRMKTLKILSISKSAIRHNMEKDLPNFKIPVCLIWGKNDKVTPPDVAQKFKSLLPNSEIFWVDNCGHAPMMEHPDLVNTLFFNWYKKTFK